MVRKETIRKMVDMHAPASRSSLDRDRAVDRIRRLTVGTTVAGIVGIGAFGGLAATTWRGADAQVTTAAITTTGDDAGSGAGSSTSSDDGTSTATDDTTATPSPTATANTQATTPTVTATGGGAHATTGSS